MQLFPCPREGCDRVAETKPWSDDGTVYCCEYCVDLDYQPKDGTDPRTEHTEFCERKHAERAA